MISIAVDKELDLFRKSGFQMHEKRITCCNHQDSQHCQNSNFLKRRKSIVEKRALIREDKKRNRVQVNHRLQSWCYRSHVINNWGKPKKQHQQNLCKVPHISIEHSGRSNDKARSQCKKHV